MNPVIICHPETLRHMLKSGTARVGENRKFDAGGLEVRADVYCPEWQHFPRPKWWRRWFLREKQKPPERVFVWLEMP